MKTIVVTSTEGSYEDITWQIDYVAVFPDDATGDEIEDALRLVRNAPPARRQEWCEVNQYTFHSENKRVFCK